MSGGWRWVSRTLPCPACGRFSNCSIAPEGDGVVCARLPSDNPCKDGRWYHKIADLAGGPGFAAPPPPPQAPRRTLGPRYAVNRTILNVLDRLSPAHKNHLRRVRKLSDDAVVSNEYATIDREGVAAVEWTFGSTGESMDGFPGFWIDEAGHLRFEAPDGLLIPVRDNKGIAGFQVRPDNPGKAKYVWVSSGSKPHGTSSGVPAHLALPLAWEGKAGRPLLLTEGPLKADVAAHHLGEAVVSVQGITTWSHPSCRLLPLLEYLKPSRVYLAFDREADPVAFARSREAARRLGAFVEAGGFRSGEAVWDPSSGKGVDDVLIAQKPIRLVDDLDLTRKDQPCCASASS